MVIWFDFERERRMILLKSCEKHDASYNCDCLIDKTAFDKHFDRPKDVPVADPAHKHIDDCYES